MEWKHCIFLQWVTNELITCVHHSYTVKINSFFKYKLGYYDILTQTVNYSIQIILNSQKGEDILMLPWSNLVAVKLEPSLLNEYLTT